VAGHQSYPRLLVPVVDEVWSRENKRHKINVHVKQWNLRVVTCNLVNTVGGRVWDDTPTLTHTLLVTTVSSTDSTVDSLLFSLVFPLHSWCMVTPLSHQQRGVWTSVCWVTDVIVSSSTLTDWSSVSSIFSSLCDDVSSCALTLQRQTLKWKLTFTDSKPSWSSAHNDTQVIQSWSNSLAFPWHFKWIFIEYRPLQQ